MLKTKSNTDRRNLKKFFTIEENYKINLERILIICIF